MTRANLILILFSGLLLSCAMLAFGAWCGRETADVVWRPPLSLPDNQEVGALLPHGGVVGNQQEQLTQVKTAVQDAASKVSAKLEVLKGLEVLRDAQIPELPPQTSDWQLQSAEKIVSAMTMIARKRLDESAGGKINDPVSVVLLAPDDILDRIRPKENESFFVDFEGEKKEFLWVAADGPGGRGFWFSKTEQPKMPASIPFVAGGVDFKKSLACKNPSKEQWLAAREARIPAIIQIDDGYGEWIEGELIIGRATIPDGALGNLSMAEWLTPRKREERVKTTKKSAGKAEINENGQQLVDAVLDELGLRSQWSQQLEGELRRDLGKGDGSTYRAKLLVARQRKQDQKTAISGENEFRYRWVLAPPL